MRASGADQSEAVAFLADAASYGGGVDAVERIDTHGALVFLAGERVYKIKRAVALPYLDFSTLERRRAACERELELNRRTAPQVYLGLAPLRRSTGGGLRLGRPADTPGSDDAESNEPVVEWVLVMRRFPQSALLDRVAARGGLTPALLRALADEVRRFHDAAIQSPEGAKPLSDVIEENATELGAWPDLFPAGEVAAYNEAMAESLRQLAGLLERRAAQGFVRRLHGDLHLGNICLLSGRPTLFDALEFDESLATIDLLYDLAFLLMDLDQRGHREAANAVLNRYLRDEDDLAGLAAMPLFLSCRAAIRAKVAATSAASQADAAGRAAKRQDAQRYFQAAVDYLQPTAAALIAVGGLSGSGKSALAYRLAPRIGRSPGAVVLRSDVIRKQLFGRPETARLGPEAYGPDTTAQIYARLAALSEVALEAGRTVVADAVFARAEQRAAIEAAAARVAAGFTGVWLEAALELRLARVAVRKGDASDATPEVARRQGDYETGPIAWTRLDAAGLLDVLAEAVIETANLTANQVAD